jgi:uncharacterized protein (DUF427 family)
MPQYSPTPQRATYLDRNPDYAVKIAPSRWRWRSVADGTLLADSAAALEIDETYHAAVVYFPRDDVAMELLEASDHRTTCPFKGEASYFNARIGDDLFENVAWSYEDPYDEVAELGGYVAFYTDRVSLLQGELQGS